MKKNFRFILVAAGLALSSVSMWAQSKVVSGVVRDDANQPLPGVAVIVPGTTIGTVTDFDGKYSINVSDDASSLQFSFIGFNNQTVDITGRSTVDVALQSDFTELDEVVAVGYGVQKKKLLTGASVQVKGDEIQQQNTTNPLTALQGKTPGVNIVSTSGQPGSSISVTIRGLGTVGNSQPLYLIDGVGGDITTLNPADIESIDVLKDAASAAIYGAQAANGVVLVTTRSGREGKGTIQYDGYYGLQNVANKFDVLNAKEYMTIMDEAALNSGNGAFDWASMASIYDANGNVYDTDWIDEVIEDNTITQSHSLSFTGGSKTSTYAISGGYTQQEGVIGGPDVSYYKRYNFRANSEHKMLDDHLIVGEHASFIYTDSRGMGTGNIWNNNLRACFSSSPLHPVYDEAGEYYSTVGTDWNVNDGNPYATMMDGRYNRSRSGTFDANVYFQIEPIKNFKFRMLYGINYSASNYRSYSPAHKGYSATSGDVTSSSVSESRGDGLSQTWTNTLTYDFDIAEVHHINLLLGSETSWYDGGSNGGSNSDIITGFDDWEHAYLTNTDGSDNKTVNGAPYDSTRGQSFFFRAGWNWKDRYMLNATVRADGSSKFADDNRWGIFPSVSAGWTISEESFMDNTKEVLDFLKLRVSWGQVGNANINCYQYLAPVTTSAANYNFGSGGGQDAWETGSYTSRLANEDVQWETSQQFNVGIDARFLASRLSLTADVYHKETKDWLVQAPVLATAGTEGPIINGGDVTNKGIEIGVTWNDEIGGTGIHYSVGANFAYNDNEVGSIPTEDGIIHGETNQIYSNAEEFYRAENGHKIGYFYGYKTAGIFQSDDDINNWIANGNGVLQSDVQPGDVKYIDVNHDGVIDDNDKVDIGCGLPDYTFGVNVSFTWKGFDLSANATGAAGFDIAQSYRDPNSSQDNYSRAILNRWTGNGTSNKTPRVTYGDVGNWQFSDLYLQDGKYFRIQNVTLGYDFKTLIKWKYLSKCRLYVQAQNLATFTEYDGMDPEIGSYNGTDGNSSDSWVSGVDMGYYPHPRTFLVGLNLAF